MSRLRIYGVARTRAFRALWIAKELGLDESSFSDCLSSAKHASIVDGDLQDGSTYGVRGTPTLFVNGRMVTNRGREAISALIDRELARTAEAKAQ